MAEQPRISVIIPVRNEEENVAELIQSLRAVLAPPYEIIFVDDGSDDGTSHRLTALHDPGRLRLVRFRKSFGKTAALMAGFAASRGEIVFTMDGDLQDDPQEIPRFLQALAQGYDLVCGWKKKRHDALGKVVASRIFNAAVRLVTGVQLHDVNCGFKALRGELARSLRLYGEMHRFLPVLAAADGYRVSEIEVLHHPRRHGRSKYGFSRLFKGFFDLVTVVLVTRFRDRPAHGFGFAAAGFFGAGVVAASIHPFLDNRLPLDLFAAVLWISSIILLAAGWVGEVLLAQHVRSRPLPSYLIEEQLD